jgi:dCMP deaminase
MPRKITTFSTGYYKHACPGAESPSGTNLDGCHAIHAEQNALLQCRDVWEIETCYITTSPCVTCVKLLLNTSCQRIVFNEEYINLDAKGIWEGAGREWVKS